jgi:hypothetical protein
MFPIPHPAFAKAYGLDALPEPTPPVRIRLASVHDTAALIRLAQLDSALAAAAELPTRAAEADVIVAETDGELVAALSLRDGLLVADPLRRSRDLVALLQQRRRQVAKGERRRRSPLRVLRPRQS